MTIYQASKYRKIFEEFNGPIPKDEDGRSYEIHHIDGNRLNNNIENLQCVSIQEHYNIHKNQKDYGACFLIIRRMNLSKEEKIKLLSENAKEMAKNNTLFFQTEKGREYTRNKNREKAKNGTHPAQTPEFRKFSSENAKKRNSINNRIPHTCELCGTIILGKANLARHKRGKYCIRS